MDIKDNKDLRIFDLNLILCEKYKTVKCYSSYEKNEYGPLISGVYFKRGTFVGKIPFRVKAKFVFNKDPKQSSENIKEICLQEYKKRGTNVIINEDNTVKIFGLFNLFCLEKICFYKFKSPTKYFGNKIVGEMYIHKDVLSNKRLFYEFEWISTNDFTETKELLKSYNKKPKLY